MVSDFHATIKLITGEEIFALVSVDNSEDEPVVIMQNPVVMKVLSTGKGQMMKIRPWLEVPGDDVYIMKYDKIITMSEVKDKMITSASSLCWNNCFSISSLLISCVLRQNPKNNIL